MLNILTILLLGGICLCYQIFAYIMPLHMQPFTRFTRIDEKYNFIIVFSET